MREVRRERGEGAEREGRGMRGGGTGKQMLAQQCSMLATSPSLITDPPTPCPLSLSLSHLVLVPLVIFAHYLTTQRGL